MRISPIFLLSMALLSASPAFAECEVVDKLAAQVGEVYHQQQSTICAAFTAADLLTQRMHKIGNLPPGERIHPLQMAAMIPIQKGRNPNLAANNYSTPGEVIEALNKLKAQGIKLCTGSELARQANNSKSAPESVEGFAERLNNSVAENRCAASGTTFGQMLQLSKSLALVSRKTWLDEFKNRCKTEIDGFQPHFDRHGLRVLLNAQHKPWPPDPSADQQFRKTLDAVLDSGDIAAIGFDPDLLSDPPTGKPDSHWASIIGRKPGPKGQCLYQLRNSWGPGCGKYPEALKCERGNLWVPAEKLFSHVHTIQHLEP